MASLAARSIFCEGKSLPNSALEHQTPNEIVTDQVAVNGIRLFTRYVGNGPHQVVVVHGGPGASHLSLVPAMDDLGSQRRLHYYDQRGGGKSAVPQETPLGWQDHVNDLRQLIDYWKLQKVTVIGHSWGALLSLLCAIHNPGRVERLLLISPAPITTQYRRRYLEELHRRTVDLGIIGRQRDLLSSGLRRRDPAAFRRSAFQLTLAPFLKDPGRYLGIAAFQISHRARDALWRSLGNYDLTDDLSKLSVQALVIHGRHDPIPLSSSQCVADLLGARFAIFEDSGHLPFFEEHDLFLRVSEEFLQHE